MTSRRAPRVLITNDDGPPGDSSPFVYPFARALVEQLGWEVRVVVPSSQKSWCVPPSRALVEGADERGKGREELLDCADYDRGVLLPYWQGWEGGRTE